MSAAQSQLNELKAIVAAHDWLRPVLECVRRVLPSGYVGAGVIRDVVWDHLHGHTQFLGCSDVDVVYFDDSDLETARDLEMQQELCRLMPTLLWEVTN